MEVDGSILVRFTKLGIIICFYRISEASNFFLFGSVVSYFYGGGIHVNDFALSLGRDLGSGILNYLFFDTGTHDRCFGTNKWYCLTHHVGSHECTVGIVVLKEWDE